MASGPSSCSGRVCLPPRLLLLQEEMACGWMAEGKGAERGEEGAGLCRSVLALVGQFFFLRDREEGHKAAGLATKGLRQQKV